MKGTITEIDIEKIVLKNVPREHDTDLATLQMSINSLGLLAPVVIDRDNTLISGSRRLKACKNLGMEKITALKFEIDYRSMTALNIQSDENLCREPLLPEELEKLISKKQSVASGKSFKEGKPGVFSIFKRLFGRA